ncbi:hypothetical protein [Embleya sp. NPDC020630]|uniref:hypothetical protein n=1 Tax=Embleya sp. NPDC020630 TaxID=3363979 RepID=UPI00379FDA4D
MPDPAADPAGKAADERPGHRAAGRLAWLAGAACVVCCALPASVAAGLLGGGALAVAAWLPTVAVVPAVAAVGLIGRSWWHRRRAAEHAQGCTGSACGCNDPVLLGLAVLAIRGRVKR